jgi:hypothetical protein
MNPLLKLEQPLIDLKTMAGLLGHMSTSDRTADGCAEAGEELAHIRAVLLECHEDIHTWWESAVHEDKAEEHDEEIAALKAELAALKASHAPPGSKGGRGACEILLVASAQRRSDHTRRVRGCRGDDGREGGGFTGGRSMTATNPEQPGFAEFLSLVRALPTDQRSAFEQLMADVRTGMSLQDAARGYLVAIGTPEDEVRARLDVPRA